MKLEQAVAILAWTTITDAYAIGGPFYPGRGPPPPFRNGVQNCRPSSRGAGAPFSPEEQAAFRRQQEEFVNQAFESLADEFRKEAKKQKFDPKVVTKQEDLVRRAIDLATEMGVDQKETNEWRDFANKGFSFVKDIVSGSYVPNSKVYDLDDTLEVMVDLPGVERENIDLTLEENVKEGRWRNEEEEEALSISGYRIVGKSPRRSRDNVEGNPEEDDGPTKVPFSKSFPLRARELETDKISASFENGVLTVRIPKKPKEENQQETSSKRIPIQ